MTLTQFTRHALLAAVTLLGVLILWQVSAAVIVFLLALALGACVYPLVEALIERGWKRGPALAMTVIGSLLVGTLFCAAILIPLIGDLERLGHDVGGSIERETRRHPESYLARLLSPAPVADEAPPDSDDSDPSVESVNGTAPADPSAQDKPAGPRISPVVMQILRSAVGTGFELFQISANIGVAVALSLYWTIDRLRFERLWLSLLPVQRRTGARKLWQAVERELGAYLRSELVQFLLGVLLLWAGFHVIGLRYPALMAVIAGIVLMIPWLGSVLAFLSVAILASPKLADLTDVWLTMQGWVALAYLVAVLCFLEFVIEPRLFRRERYNSLWIVLVTMAMTLMFGLWGLLFGPPAGYSIQILLRQLYPLLVYRPAAPQSLEGIAERLAILKQRYGDDTDTPPEIVSFLERLDAIVQSQTIATSPESPAEV